MQEMLFKKCNECKTNARGQTEEHFRLEQVESRIASVEYLLGLWVTSVLVHFCIFHVKK